MVLFSAKKAGEEIHKQPTEQIDLDLTDFERFRKSHFGFMHPRRSYSFVKELNVHWQRPHPGLFIWGDIEKKEGEYD